jgi:hypothetical protein
MNTRQLMVFSWKNYAMRLAIAERDVAEGRLHPDNWLDYVFAPSGVRWPSWVTSR